MKTVHRGKLLEHRAGIEAGEEHHPRPVGEHAVGRDEQTMGMEHRERVQQHVVGPEPPHLVQRGCVRREVALREQRTLRPAGRAARVEDRGELVGTALDVVEPIGLVCREIGQCPGTARVGGEDVITVLRAAPLRVAHDDRGLGVVEQIPHLGTGVRGVHGQEHRTGAQAREVQEDRQRRLVDLHRDAVAGTHALQRPSACAIRADARSASPYVNRSPSGISSNIAEGSGRRSSKSAFKVSGAIAPLSIGTLVGAVVACRAG